MSDALIDLHLHSTCSDGNESPRTVIEQAALHGLDVVALTDHDSTEGWAEAAAACAELGLTFVPGMELSATVPGGSVHILAYLFDPEEPALAAECAQIRDDRYWRLDAMADRLAVDYPQMTREFVHSFHTEGGTLGRPTLARALQALGVVDSISEAFDTILSADNDRYYVGHYAPTVERAIEFVRAAGGVPIMAHPWTLGRTSLAFAEMGDEAVHGIFARLAANGLAGVEIDHEENTPYGRERLRVIAAELGLIVTGSSDYHGRGMKPVSPGAHTTSPEMFERIVSAASGSRVQWARPL